MMASKDKAMMTKPRVSASARITLYLDATFNFARDRRMEIKMMIAKRIKI